LYGTQPDLSHANYDWWPVVWDKIKESDPGLRRDSQYACQLMDSFQAQQMIIEPDYHFSYT
jgi:hypothetical protein